MLPQLYVRHWVLLFVFHRLLPQLAIYDTTARLIFAGNLVPYCAMHRLHEKPIHILQS